MGSGGAISLYMNRQVLVSLCLSAADPLLRPFFAADFNFFRGRFPPFTVDFRNFEFRQLCG